MKRLIKELVTYPFKSPAIMIRYLLAIQALFLLFLPARAQQDTRLALDDTIRLRDQVIYDTVYLDSSGFCSLLPEQFFDRSRPEYSKTVLSLDRNELHCEDAGSQVLYLITTDEAGITSYIPLSLTVMDTIPPRVQTRNNTLLLENTGTVIPDPRLFDDGSHDACGIREMRLIPDMFGCEDIGVHQVLLSITDNNGNRATGPVEVTVRDNIPPTVKVRELEAELDDQGTLTLGAGNIDDFSHDPCGLASLHLDPSEFDCGDIGENLVTLTVIDKQGNLASREARVIISDHTPPEARTRNISLELDEHGHIMLTAEDIDDGSTDNCGIRSIRVSQVEFNCDHTGGNRVVLTVTDVNGNTTEEEAEVRIRDRVPPDVRVKDISITLDETGKATITAKDIDDGSTDNCRIRTMELSRSVFTEEHLGENEITLTAYDVSGNHSNARAIVTVTRE